LVSSPRSGFTRLSSLVSSSKRDLVAHSYSTLRKWGNDMGFPDNVRKELTDRLSPELVAELDKLHEKVFGKPKDDDATKSDDDS
jgi:hypothetical protein